MITPTRVIFSIYAAAWLWLVGSNAGALGTDKLLEVFGNALIICLFVGLGINVNAFVLRNKDGHIRTLRDRILYVRQNLVNVVTFFVVPFCVSSSSSIVLAVGEETLVQAVFGTDSYLLIMLLGFVVFILLPALYLGWRHGWRESDIPGALRGPTDDEE